MKTVKCFALALILLLITTPALANSFFSQFIDPKDGKLDTSQWLATGTGFLPIPIFVSDPAVGYGGGLALAFFHESKDEPTGEAGEDDILTLFDLFGGIPGIPRETLDDSTAVLGLILNYDSRDNILSPSDGHLAKLHTMFYNEAFGGDYDYTKVKASSYSYWPVLESVVLGVRLEGDFSDGDTPLYDVPFIDMRGIPALRYQDDNVVVGELEARWDITFRWSLVGFGGGGLTGDNISNLGDESAK